MSNQTKGIVIGFVLGVVAAKVYQQSMEKAK